MEIIREALEAAIYKPGAESQEKCREALKALRGLEWKPIAEMDEYIGSPGLVVGARSECGGHWEVIGGVHSKALALAHHATHFCRPILPTPPKREERVIGEENYLDAQHMEITGGKNA